MERKKKLFGGESLFTSMELINAAESLSQSLEIVHWICRVLLIVFKMSLTYGVRFLVKL